MARKDSIKSPLGNTSLVAYKVCRYFQAEVIGSFLLRDYIDEDLINDYDIAVPSEVVVEVANYLTDQGFVEEGEHNTRHSEGYQDFTGSLVFNKENHVPIHLCKMRLKFEVKSHIEILQDKIKRFNESDQAQIKNLIEKGIYHDRAKSTDKDYEK